MKNGFLILGLVVVLSACADMSILMPKTTEKAQLTPMGQLNVCVLDQAKLKIQDASTFNDVNRAANQVANYCIRKLDMLESGLYGQAVLNATSIINSYKK